MRCSKLALFFILFYVPGCRITIRYIGSRLVRCTELSGDSFPTAYEGCRLLSLYKLSKRSGCRIRYGCFGQDAHDDERNG